MKELVKNQLIKNGWKPGVRLLLAISGGVDSMLLWHVIHDLELDYGIAHVNFKLRGSESDADQKLIETTAKTRKTKLFSIQKDAANYAEEHRISIQMAAREIRYDWFKQLMEENQFDFLCTAHHLNDSIETFFINLDRGTGIKGLSGIKSTNQILRPLIELSKEEIRNQAEIHSIDFREDQSNQVNKYKRNWLRNVILKAWRIQNPSFEKTMAKNLSHLAQVEKVYHKAIEKDLMAIRAELNSGFFLTETANLLEFPEESLFELLNVYGFSLTQIQNLQRGIRNNQVGFRLEASGYELNLDREKVLLRTKEMESAEPEILIFKYQNVIEKPIHIDLKLIANSGLIHTPDSKVEHIDLDKLTFPLKMRKWEKGDKMRPLGMKGQKKISDILVDEKVPLIEKESCWVIESNQKIVWLVGYTVSEDFKVDSRTQQVLKLQLND